MKRMIRKRERLFKMARCSKRASLWQSYKKYLNLVKIQIHLAHSNYVNDIIGSSLEVGDGKAFWNYIKLQRTESIGIPPLRVGDNVFDSNEAKADILNKHLQSVFSLEDTSNLPQLPPRPYPWIDQLIINIPGWEKQLQKLKPNKAAGPDQISPWVLKTFDPQCAQVLPVIFTQSYVSGILPEGWKKALVSPVLKKEDKSLPNNYRPISLTCISCKITDHVLCSHLSKHLEINNILTPHQHGFRKGFSTETQLISVLDDWLSSLYKQTMTDVLLIDFSKAFDSVPHQRLLLKLNYYGITGNSLSWIENFLLDRTQYVQVSGPRSSWISVTPGVPQDTVIGPLLFLIYINDIVHNLNSKLSYLLMMLFSIPKSQMFMMSVYSNKTLTLYPAGLLLGKWILI